MVYEQSSDPPAWLFVRSQPSESSHLGMQAPNSSHQPMLRPAPIHIVIYSHVYSADIHICSASIGSASITIVTAFAFLAILLPAFVVASAGPDEVVIVPVFVVLVDFSTLLIVVVLVDVAFISDEPLIVVDVEVDVLVPLLVTVPLAPIGPAFEGLLGAGFPIMPSPTSEKLAQASLVVLL